MIWRPFGELRRILPRNGPVRIVWLVSLVIVSALTEGVGLLLLVPMLTTLGAGSGHGRIGALFEAAGLSLSLGPMLALFVALVALRAVVNFARGLAAQRFGTDVVDRLRRQAWSALLHCDWRTLSAMRQSDNASLLITNLDRVGHGVNQLIASLATAATLAGIGMAALAVSPVLVLAAAGGGILVLWAYRGLFRRAFGLGEQVGRAYFAVHGRLTEGLDALRVIKSFGREAQAADGVNEGFSALRRAERTYLRDSGLGQMALQAGGAAVLAGIVWFGLTRWNVGTAAILALVALFARALPLVGALQSAWQNWLHSLPALTSALALIAKAEAAREPDPGGAAAPGLTGSIELDEASVRFDGRPLPALDRVSLSLPARRITALVGPSGAGKSTLADLLGGLIAPDAGTVRVDGVDLDGGIRLAWRSRVAYIQQDPVLFTGTVRENLAWADPRAGEADMKRALAEASAGFVDGLPLGLDTPVGDGGNRLSGGERQRIVLARALLRDPALLILDEATSALDRENEAAIGEALLRLRERMAVLVVCHRGELLGIADQVISLDRGRVTGVDTRAAGAA